MVKILAYCNFYVRFIVLFVHDCQSRIDIFCLCLQKYNGLSFWIDVSQCPNLHRHSVWWFSSHGVDRILFSKFDISNCKRTFWISNTRQATKLTILNRAFWAPIAIVLKSTKVSEGNIQLFIEWWKTTTQNNKTWWQSWKKKEIRKKIEAQVEDENRSATYENEN